MKRKSKYLIVLDVMECFFRLGSVSPHHVVVHQSLGAEQRETAGRTHDTSWKKIKFALSYFM